MLYYYFFKHAFGFQYSIPENNSQYLNLVLDDICLDGEDKMIVPVDEKRGKLLLAEILNGGNFGKHFTKYGGFTHQSMGKKYFLKIWRNMHFVRYYPAEALSEPIFRTWHFFWRMKNKN